MQQTAAEPLKKTPLHARHLASGARMTSFGGWDMPIEYSGIAQEHCAVRTGVGLFDVSHMGEIEMAGRDALGALQLIASNDAGRLAIGQAQYSALMTPQGTFVDDVLVYRLGTDHFLLVVNAGNIAKDYGWIAEHIPAGSDAVAVDASSRYALVAVQGPRALSVVQPLTSIDLSGLKYYWFCSGEVAGIRATISRTGYTGEDGFEIFVAPQAADRLWAAMLDAGRPAGIVPCGLGARDTLRLEASMRLYGNDIDETTTALEADLEWIIGWKKPDFIGAEALRTQRRDGLGRKIAGFEMIDRGIARHGHAAFVSDTEKSSGVVTSGTQTPYLKKAIGMAYLPVDYTAAGTEFSIDVRGRRLRARVVPMPFYTRKRA